MDSLSRLQSAAHGLLTLVDETIARDGCRADHPIWPLLRQSGRLPGAALACAAGWLPGELDTRAQLLARQRDSEAEIAAALSASAAWEGDAFAAFQARLDLARQTFSQVNDSGVVLAGWFTELSTYLHHARLRLAYIVARTLHSAEAVTLKVGPLHRGDAPTAQAEAAATIGTSILTEVHLFWHGGLNLSRDWHTRLAATTSLAPLASLASAAPHIVSAPRPLRADL